MGGKKRCATRGLKPGIQGHLCTREVVLRALRPPCTREVVLPPLCPPLYARSCTSRPPPLRAAQAAEITRSSASRFPDKEDVATHPDAPQYARSCTSRPLPLRAAQAAEITRSSASRSPNKEDVATHPRSPVRANLYFPPSAPHVRAKLYFAPSAPEGCPGSGDNPKLRFAFPEQRRLDYPPRCTHPETSG